MYICHIIAAVIFGVLVLKDLSKISMITVLNDEFGYWSNAALMAGAPWKTITQHTPYYGIGYSLVLYPLFVIFNNTATMYKTAIVINYAFVLLSYYFANKIGRFFFPEKDVCTISIASLAAVSTCSNLYYSQMAWTETWIVFLYWALIYVLINFEKTFKFRYLCIAFMILLLMYTSHLRTIGLLLSVTMFLLLSFKRNKARWYLYILIPLILLPIYLLQQKSSLFLSSLIDNERITNLNDLKINGDTVSDYFSLLKQNAKNLSLSFLGKSLVMVISTLGLAFVYLCYWLKDTRKIKEAINRSDYLCSSFIILSSVIMLGLQMVQMMNGGRRDIVVYSRYMDFVVGPLVLLGLCYLGHSKLINRVVLSISAVFSALAVLGIERYSWADASDGLNVLCSPFVGALSLLTKTDYSSIHSAIIWLMLLTVIVMFAVTSRKFTANTCVVSISVLFIAINILLSHYPIKSTRDYRLGRERITDDATKIIENDYSDYNIIYICNPETDMWCFYMKYLQFSLYDREVVIVDDENDIDNNVPTLVLIGSTDDREYDILEDAELIVNNGYYAIYSVDGVNS